MEIERGIKMDIGRISIPPDMAIIEAIKQMDDTAKQILLVVEHDILKGVITDGDIRRWILKRGDLQQHVALMMNTNPTVITSKKIYRAEKIMLYNKIQALPVVDEYYKPIDIIFFNSLYKNEEQPIQPIELPVVIMAGGKGTRLYPYTKILPKPLIPIGEMTILERIMQQFEMYGCNNFFITVNYKKNMIKSYLQDCNCTSNIEYVEEEQFLGTGGSLYLLKDKLHETFFLSNCDILVKADYADILKMHKSNHNKITMVTSLKTYIIPYGVIQNDESGYIAKIEEKPQYNFQVNTGLYVIEPEVLEDITENTFFHITDLIQTYMDKGEKVGIYPITEKSWLDMGEFKEMEHMIKELGV